MYKSFDVYVNYLVENRDRIQPHVYEFASDENRHNLDSPHSLHDAWLSSVTVRENRRIKRPFEPSPSIEIELVGPMHDRDILLSYSEVEEYEMEGRQNKVNWADTFHGDILCHEVRLEEDGLLSHELQFSSESRIRIVCKDFRCTEKVYA